ncbi:Ras-related protein Rab-26 [Paragonimus westermani]|uniref:Ras-related protein Rab-26 n=1 Tax=Paragonimus westermani TaxID=34504 RepID=A0A5J4NL25_9TREM|nr:Ras-related protein Rab-26 [Paragonimus westermani]
MPTSHHLRSIAASCAKLTDEELLLVGDSCVGKTSLLIRFKDRIFLKGSYISTVGIDFKTKMVNADGRTVRLQIWDTAGQEKFRSLTKSYYRDSNAVILVYDIGRSDTFVNTKSWMCEINANILSNTLIALVGNKADETKDRVVSKSDGERLAKESGALFWETSAKTGTNVDQLFQSIADLFSPHENKIRGLLAALPDSIERRLAANTDAGSPIDRNGLGLVSCKERLSNGLSDESHAATDTKWSTFQCCAWN